MSNINERKTSTDGLRVLSLCGGVETGLYALQQLGIPVKEYHTYEILPEAIAVSQYHFPFVVHHGDLYEADFEQFKGFDLLLVSTCCQSLSRVRIEALDTFDDSDAEYGDTIDAFNKRVNKSGCSPTLTTRPEGFKTAILPVTNNLRIRKLTPKECFRLMGFSDENFEAAHNVGISNSQLYKQAGNSIVVDVLYYIFVELYKAMPYLFDDLKLSSFFSGIGAFEVALDRLYKGINSGNFMNPQAD